MGYIDSVVKEFIQMGSSDLHLSVGKPARARYHGEIQPIPSFEKIITLEDIDIFMQDEQESKLDTWEQLKSGEIHSIDSSVTLHNRRFRLHFYQSSSGIVMVMRILQEHIPTIEELNLPEEVRNLERYSKGLVLVTGATGSGKSTTLAAILDEINASRDKVIVTVEDPIEYIYKEKKARIEQREVGSHVESFSSATRDMMREDPDIILVGEMRDVSTIKNAITLSETGHLVLSTLHTKSVSDSIDRMVDVFPAEQQRQIRMQLSYVLIGILNQTLIGTDNNEIIPLCELLMNDSVIASMIRQSKSGVSIKDYMRSCKNGSIHVVDNALWHIENGRLTLSKCESLLSVEDIAVLKSMLADKGLTDKVLQQNTRFTQQTSVSLGQNTEKTLSDESHIKQGFGVRSVGKRRF